MYINKYSSLRNTCLGYLTKGGAADDQVRAHVFYIVYIVSLFSIYRFISCILYTSCVHLYICIV